MSQNIIHIDTTNLFLTEFADSLTKSDKTNFERAKTLMNFVNLNLRWLPTDYEERTIKEILARGGGNCFELAKVYMALVRSTGIIFRPIAEINIQPYSISREENSSKKIEQFGNKMSVFGGQFNDHRWVEVYDIETGDWVPVDPTMNVFGTEQWLKARVWFGKRNSIDTSFTNSMIVPFAIFVTDSTRSNMTESRSEHYLIKEFNNLYGDELSQLPSWATWTKLILQIQNHAENAFEGKENLHKYSKEISELFQTYSNLKIEYLNGIKRKQ